MKKIGLVEGRGMSVGLIRDDYDFGYHHRGLHSGECEWAGELEHALACV